jgi:hypothetical protein
MPDPDACGACFRSRIDNPVIVGGVQLRVDDDGKGHVVSEGAERANNGFRYDFFSMRMGGSGDSNRGAVPPDNLIPEPRWLGLWQVDSAHPTVAMPWEAHGIELGYSLTEASAKRSDAFSRSAVIPDPVKVQLDRVTMLVPIQLIRVLPPPDEPHFKFLNSFSQRSYKAFWDDMLVLDTSRISEPDIPNKTSIHAPAQNDTDNKVLFTRPDEVWNQCGIQFRMINCSSNRTGCPDLMVESRDNILPLECELGGIRNFKHMRQNRSLALGLPGVDRDLPMVLTVSQVSGPCLNVIPLDVAELGWAAIGMSNQTPLLGVAHELGHVLGLDDDECRDSGRHLMCTNEAAQTNFIRPQDCARARRVAALYVKKKWGVDVAP